MQKDGCNDRDAVRLRTHVGTGNHVLDGGPEVLRDVALATNFRTQISITGLWAITLIL